MLPPTLPLGLRAVSAGTVRQERAGPTNTLQNREPVAQQDSGVAGERGWEWLGDTGHRDVEKRTREAQGSPNFPGPHGTTPPSLSILSFGEMRQEGREEMDFLAPNACCCLFSGLPRSPCHVSVASSAPHTPGSPGPAWAASLVACDSASSWPKGGALIGCRAWSPRGQGITHVLSTRPGSAPSLSLLSAPAALEVPL